MSMRLSMNYITASSKTRYIWQSEEPCTESICAIGIISFTAGVIFYAWLTLRGRTVLDYPFSPLPRAIPALNTAHTTMAYGLLCLMVACLTAYFKHVSGRTLGFIDGALSSYSALGIYLFPYLSLHKPLLLIVFLLTAAIVLYECLFIYIDVQILHAAWHAINYVACLCAFIMLLCSAGYIPLTSSDITLAVGESDTLETNGDFIRSMARKQSFEGEGLVEIANQMQTLAHIEAKRLGLQDHEPRVAIGFVGTSLASYYCQTNSIVISLLYLRRNAQDEGLSGTDAINCIAHEMAHAYEHAVVEGLIPGRRKSPLGIITPEITERWQREFCNPVDANKDYRRYWRQDIEVRARRYAAKEVETYCGFALGRYL